jgi:hypothetical protein
VGCKVLQGVVGGVCHPGEYDEGET